MDYKDRAELSKIARRCVNELHSEYEGMSGANEIIIESALIGAVEESRKKTAVQACRLVCADCADRTPFDGTNHIGHEGYECPSYSIRSHFNLTDKDFEEPKK